MDTEFHYWITAHLAHSAGFTESEAAVIAYASEYVDENDICLRVVDRRTKKGYRNFITQTMNILKPKGELMRIYPIYHFVPGEPDAASARRRDGKMHRLNTTPDSEYANALLDGAFRAGDDTRLYRIGIASHMFADTWAHQNFVGWWDSYNMMAADLTAHIGHADAVHHPDWVSHRWVDHRLLDAEVDNGHRFLAAAAALYRRYCDHLATRRQADRSADWPEVEDTLVKLMGRPFSGDECHYREERLGRYRASMPWLPEFDENRWFDAAVERRVRGLKDSEKEPWSLLTVFRDDYLWREDVERESTRWYAFQEAVKDHERLALETMQPTFGAMGIKLAKV